MNDSPTKCPSCGADLAKAEDGSLHCPACGFKGDQIANQSRAGRAIFWIALVTPAAWALTTVAVGTSSRSNAEGFGLLGLVPCFVASFYCGFWLARRMLKPGVWMVFTGLGLTAVFSLVNFFIICAGCAAASKA